MFRFFLFGGKNFFFGKFFLLLFLLYIFSNNSKNKATLSWGWNYFERNKEKTITIRETFKDKNYRLTILKFILYFALDQTYNLDLQRKLIVFSRTHLLTKKSYFKLRVTVFNLLIVKSHIALISMDDQAKLDILLSF